MTQAASDLGRALGDRLGRVAAPGAAAALISDGEVVWQGASGVSAPSTGEPVVAETAFLWFSMTKIATATAVMQLADAASIELDAAAAEFVSLQGLDERITVRHLLNHSSGIANPPPLRWIHPAGEAGPEPRALVERLLARYGKPKFEPGDHSAYTNIGYLVLGELITAVSGLRYQRYVVERVLEPIGAASTGFALPDRASDRASEGAHPRRDPMLPLMRLLVPRWSLGPAVGRWRLFNPFCLDGSAYGGLIGPVGDAALLAAAHLGGGKVGDRRILSEESAAEMQRIAATGKRFDAGLGWLRRHRDSERGLAHIEHLGGGGGYGTVMRIWPERGLGVVAMANVSSQKFDYEALIEPLADG